MLVVLSMIMLPIQCNSKQIFSEKSEKSASFPLDKCKFSSAAHMHETACSRNYHSSEEPSTDPIHRKNHRII